MSNNRVKFALASRGIRVPPRDAECRALLMNVFATEAQPGYGKPRIYYPDLWNASIDAEYKAAKEDDDDDIDPVTTSIDHATPQDWPEMGRGDNWLTNQTQVGLLAPLLSLKVQKTYFRTEWNQMETENKFVRAMHKGATNTEQRKDQIRVEYSADDGSCRFRCSQQHSMSSKNTKSKHFGFTTFVSSFVCFFFC